LGRLWPLVSESILSFPSFSQPSVLIILALISLLILMAA